MKARLSKVDRAVDANDAQLAEAKAAGDADEIVWLRAERIKLLDQQNKVLEQQTMLLQRTQPPAPGACPAPERVLEHQYRVARASLASLSPRALRGSHAPAAAAPVQPAVRVKQLLAAGNVTRADAKAMRVMELRFSTQMLTVSSPAAALTLYNLCRALPGSATIAAVDRSLGIKIEGPLWQGDRALLLAMHRSGTRAPRALQHLRSSSRATTRFLARPQARRC